MAKSTVRISRLGKLPGNVGDLDIIPIVHNGKTYNIYVSELLKSVNSSIDDKEDDLGKPLYNGQYLVSDIQGNRTWVSGTDIGDAAQVNTNSLFFDKNLSTDDDTVQKALDKLDELLTISIVGNDSERDLLSPKEGDFCKVTDHDVMYIYKDSWINIQREDITVLTVSNTTDRDLLSPRTGDICNVTNESKAYVYSGLSWVELLSSPIQDLIDDNIIATDKVWSSNKVAYRDLDGGTF